MENIFYNMIVTVLEVLAISKQSIYFEIRGNNDYKTWGRQYGSYAANIGSIYAQEYKTFFEV